MAGSDPSIYAQVGANVTPLVNPLAQQAQVYQTAGNALAVQDAMARKAAGQAFQQSINPDGTTNQPALLQNLAADPNAAMAAQQSAQQGQTLSAQEYGQHITRLAYGANAGAQLLTTPGGPTLPAIKAAYDQAVQDGHMTAADEAAVMQGFGSDPAQNAAIIKQRLLGNFNAQQALTAALPNYTPTNTGGTTFFRDANPITNPNGMGSTGTGFTNTPGPQYIGNGAANIPTTGGVPLAGAPAIPNQLTPGELAAPAQTGMTPAGAPIVGTTGQRLGILGVGTDGKPLQSPLGTGRLPSALMNPNKPQAAASAAAPTAASQSAPGTAMAAGGAPGIVTGLSPAAQAAASTQGAASASAFQDIANQGVQAQSQNAILGNMLGDTASFTSGETGANNFKATIQRQAPAIASAFGIKPDQIAAYESFDKLANQIASAQGAGSDARLAVAQGANPSPHLSAAGVDQILRQLQGNADYLQARSKVAAAYPDQSNRAGFEAQVGSQLDPRAFQFERMTPQQKTSYVATLSPQDRKTLQASYNYAHNSGLIGSAPAPQQTAPANGY